MKIGLEEIETGWKPKHFSRNKLQLETWNAKAKKKMELKSRFENSIKQNPNSVWQKTEKRNRS